MPKSPKLSPHSKQFSMALAPAVSDHSVSNDFSFAGGLFIDPVISISFLRLLYLPPNSHSRLITQKPSQSVAASNFPSAALRRLRPRKRNTNCEIRAVFLSLSLSSDGGIANKSTNCTTGLGNGSEFPSENAVAISVAKGKNKAGSRRAGAINTTKHLWSGAVAATVSRTFVAPLERLKLEYILRGEQKNILDLVRTIGATQGLRGFWKGNFLNILRTAPFKAINFCAYDAYRKQLIKFSANEETSNSQRFLAGAAAGITATILCLPLDTIRTRIIARGGENLGGVIGAFRHMVHNEGFFSLYKGLLPSIASIAPSSAVFYGVYDVLKSSYLQSPEGRRRIQKMRQQEPESTAFDQLELGPLKTFLYGAISGACAEAATYPFEVLRRRLQMQVPGTRLNALTTFVNIAQQGGIPALYAGLLPSLLQVLPSAATSYFVYECMKILLKVE